jgi:hypothetical protein
MTDTLSISGEMFADVAGVVERTDYSALLREFRYSIANEKAEMFENQSDVHGNPWASLAESTIQKKGHDTILVETGALRTSLVDVDGEGNFNEVDSHSLTYGSLVPYALVHESAYGNRPARPTLGISAELMAEFEQKVLDRTIEEMNKSLEQVQDTTVWNVPLPPAGGGWNFNLPSIFGSGWNFKLP